MPRLCSKNIRAIAQGKESFLSSPEWSEFDKFRERIPEATGDFSGCMASLMLRLPQFHLDLRAFKHGIGDRQSLFHKHVRPWRVQLARREAFVNRSIEDPQLATLRGSVYRYSGFRRAKAMILHWVLSLAINIACKAAGLDGDPLEDNSLLQ